MGILFYFSVAFLVIVFVLALLFGFILITFFGIWLRAKVAGASVPFSKLISMKLSQVPAKLIVDNRIAAMKAGLAVDTNLLEAHHLAGGNVSDVILALIVANKAGITLGFNQACAIDLAMKGMSKTVLEAVRSSISSRVIDCSDSSRGNMTIDAITRDGVVLKIRVRVTVRSQLEKLENFVGGATEETIIARISEGIVAAVGPLPSYLDVLEKPEAISQAVLNKKLDSDTALEILSIDIVDIAVGQNMWEQLQVEQAEADKTIAQAKAEMRRAVAVASEQEMVAKTQSMRAKVVEAEAQIPHAIAHAFRSGNLGVFDYTRMKNIISDTHMREHISGKKFRMF